MRKLHTVFDFGQVSYISGPSIFFLMFVGIGLVIFLYNLAYGDKETKTTFGMSRRNYGMVFGAFFCLFGLTAILKVVTVKVETHYSAKRIYASGKYKTAEGIVKNYHPMPAEGHDMERFDVDGVHFEFADFDLTNPGYKVPAVNGGVFKDGLYVQILYVTEYDRNEILRLKTE